MFNPKVLLLALNYLGIVTASLGMLFFIPQIIKSLGNYRQHDGRLADHDPLHLRRHRAGGVGPRLRPHERAALEPAASACVLSTGGLVLAGLTMGTWWALVGMSLAAMGFYGSKGPFFAMPPMFLSGTALAAGFAWINSIGNLGGFFGPWWVGVMKDLTGSYAGGLYGLALLSLVVGGGVRALPAHPRSDDPGTACPRSRPHRRGEEARPPRLPARAVALDGGAGGVSGTADPHDRAVPARRRHRRGGAAHWPSGCRPSSASR